MRRRELWRIQKLDIEGLSGTISKRSMIEEDDGDEDGKGKATKLRMTSNPNGVYFDLGGQEAYYHAISCDFRFYFQTRPASDLKSVTSRARVWWGCCFELTTARQNRVVRDQSDDP
jgi:hypothetical protein